ncbi:MAG: NAD(P)-dependent oxidoreductase [Rhodospirillaceae bacterium]
MTDGTSREKAPPFPTFIDLDGAEVLVVGGGDIAERRAEAVLRAGARVRLAATDIGAGLERLIAGGRINVLGRGFEPTDVQGCRLVMAATDDDTLNATVSACARAAGVPVNVADNMELCTFIMPAIVDRSPIIVAVSTGGAAPILSRRAKAVIEAALPAAFGTLAAYAGTVRDRINGRIARGRTRRRFWQYLADGPIAECIRAGDVAGADALVEAAIERLLAGDQIDDVGDISLIGTGSGDPDMLPMLALRLMQGGEIVFHDADVPAAILDLARKDAPRRVIADPAAAWAEAVTEAEGGHSVLWFMSGRPALPDAAGADARARLDAKGIAIRLVPAAG